MQTDNRILDDIAKIASGALGSVAGLKQEIEALIQSRLERLLRRADLVTRDEFEAMKALAQEAREAAIRLERRLAALEGKSDSKGPTSRE